MGGTVLNGGGSLWGFWLMVMDGGRCMEVVAAETWSFVVTDVSFDIVTDI